MKSGLPPALKHLTVWLLLGTAVFLGVQAWMAGQQRTRFQVADGRIELQRAPDGHFRWPGSINGVAVEFLVDTGATRTALPQALAERAGLVAEARTQSQTAGGVAEGYVARADLQLAGGIAAAQLRVTVLPALRAPLLGMDMLSRLQFSQQGGVLRIEPLQSRP
ncbi:MAG: retropepsin-like aspartic protease [Rubrivivax sp.]